MNLAVLGTGMVGIAIASRAHEVGHQVAMGSRTAGNAAAAAWAEDHNSTHGTFADVAAWGDVIVNATGGLVTLDVLASVGQDPLRGKTILDVSNPLDFSRGFPPTIVQANGLSVGEQIQAAFPDAHVVKTLNTMNADVMVKPSLVPGDHNVFVAGENAAAKAGATALLLEFGWRPEQVVDFGGISAARGLEQYLPWWLAAMSALGTPVFNIAINRG